MNVHRSVTNINHHYSYKKKTRNQPSNRSLYFIQNAFGREFIILRVEDN